MLMKFFGLKMQSAKIYGNQIYIKFWVIENTVSTDLHATDRTIYLFSDIIVHTLFKQIVITSV